MREENQGALGWTLVWYHSAAHSHMWWAQQTECQRYVHYDRQEKRLSWFRWGSHGWEEQTTVNNLCLATPQDLVPYVEATFFDPLELLAQVRK